MMLPDSELEIKNIIAFLGNLKVKIIKNEKPLTFYSEFGYFHDIK
jgi:hypothetical protein